MASKRNLFDNVGSSSAQGRASWSRQQVKVFLEQLIVEKNVGNWTSKTPSPLGYTNIMRYFDHHFGKCFSKGQLRTKFDALKATFHLWINMFNNQTGAGFEVATGRMIMEAGWWDNVIQMNPNYKKFREEGLENADLMYNVFGDGSATGAYQFTPTANDPRLRNTRNIFSQVGETETSPPRGQNIHLSANEVTSPLRNPTQESVPSRISGGKRKSSEETFRERVDVIRQEFYSAPMPTEYVLKNADDTEWPIKDAMDILYDMQESEDLEDELFDIGLNELQHAGFRKVWLCCRKNSDRVRMLKKKK